MLISREPELTARFREFFTDSLDLDRYIDEQVQSRLRAWQAAARTAPVGTVLTVPVIRVGQTTAVVGIADGVTATVSVKQMRAAGFGPTHWFALDEYVKPGHLMTVQIARIDAGEQAVRVEFLRMDASSRDSNGLA